MWLTNAESLLISLVVPSPKLRFPTPPGKSWIFFSVKGGEHRKPLIAFR